MSFVKTWMQRFRIAYGNDSVYLYNIKVGKERFFRKIVKATVRFFDGIPKRDLFRPAFLKCLPFNNGDIKSIAKSNRQNFNLPNWIMWVRVTLVVSLI